MGVAREIRVRSSNVRVQQKVRCQPALREGYQLLDKLSYTPEGVGLVCNLSQCLRQIQDEVAAPPDGTAHVSRKTQTVVCFDRGILSHYSDLFSFPTLCW